jgi:Fic family protein
VYIYTGHLEPFLSILSPLDKDSKQSFAGIKSAELSDLSVRLREKCTSLYCILHPVTLSALKKIISVSKAYYSCKAEGHEISPVEIEKALQGNYSRQKSKRLIQQEAAAYIETENEITEKILREPDVNICSLEFISRLHIQLFEKLPDEFKRVRSRNGKIIYVVPGELRKEGLINNGNEFPKAKQVRKLLIRFEEVFNPLKFTLADSPIALALAHDMLSWVRPFLAGSDMVLRLFTGEYFTACGLKGTELFSMNRALLNKIAEYKTAISKSYNYMKNFLSRGALLLDENLITFCRLFLQTALDEADYMCNILNPENVIRRLNSYTERLVSEGELREECKLVLRTVFLSGEMKRGEVLQLTGRPERTARRILGELLNKGLLISDSPKGPVRINFPMKSAIEIFNDLF